MTNDILTVGPAQLHLSVVGATAKHAWLVFHGFAQDRLALQPVASQLAAADHGQYFFDLPFHGHSTFPLPIRPVRRGEWGAAVREFLDQRGVERVSVLAFSIGTKLGLGVVDQLAERVDQVVLLAPEGLKVNLWYKIATWPTPLRWFYKYTIGRPRAYYGLVRLLRRLGVVTQSTVKFADSQMATKALRQRVYYNWQYHRHLRFSLSQLSAKMEQNGVHLQVFLGARDRVLPPGRLQKALAHFPKAEVTTLPCGHTRLPEAVEEHLAHKAQADRDTPA